MLFDLQDIFERKLKQPSCTQVGSVWKVSVLLQSRLKCPDFIQMISICSGTKAVDLYNPARVLRCPQQRAMRGAPLHFMMCFIAVTAANDRKVAREAKWRL